MNTILKNSDNNASVHEQTFYHMAFNHKDGTCVHARTHTHGWYGLLWHLMNYIRVTQCKFTVTFFFLLYRCTLGWILCWKANRDWKFLFAFVPVKTIWILISFALLTFLNNFCQGRIWWEDFQWFSWSKRTPAAPKKRINQTIILIMWQ